MAGLQECPHCHAEVLFLTGDTCPACRKSAGDPNGATPHLRRSTITKGDELPDVCLTCGVDTERREGFGAELQQGGESPFVRFLLFLAVLIGPLGLALAGLRNARGQQRSVALQLPRCEACARSGGVRDRHTDFDRMQVTFLAHRTFADAKEDLDRLRAAPSLGRRDHVERVAIDASARTDLRRTALGLLASWSDEKPLLTAGTTLLDRHDVSLGVVAIALIETRATPACTELILGYARRELPDALAAAVTAAAGRINGALGGRGRVSLAGGDDLRGNLSVDTESGALAVSEQTPPERG